MYTATQCKTDKVQGGGAADSLLMLQRPATDKPCLNEGPQELQDACGDSPVLICNWDVGSRGGGCSHSCNEQNVATAAARVHKFAA